MGRPRAGRAPRRARITVSQVATVEEAFVAHANLYLGYDIDADALLRRARLSGGFESFLALMLCAEGAVDAAFAPRGFLWDLLPAQLIVEEAGGRFTDLDGRRTAAGRGAVAANPQLHQALGLSALSSVWGGRPTVACEDAVERIARRAGGTSPASCSAVIGRCGERATPRRARPRRRRPQPASVSPSVSSVRKLARSRANAWT